MASRMGCEVVGVTGSAEKVSFIKDLGAHHVVVADNAGKFHKKAIEALRGRGADVVLECVGSPTFESSMRSLAPGGRMVLIGNVDPSHPPPIPLGLAIISELEVIGGDSITAAELADVFAFLKNNGIRPRIQQTLTLRDVHKAHAMLEGRQILGRVVLAIDTAW